MALTIDQTINILENPFDYGCMYHCSNPIKCDKDCQVKEAFIIAIKVLQEKKQREFTEGCN